MDLKARVLEGELMDAPDLPSDRHVEALTGLRRVNLLSGTASVIARAIRQHFGRRPSQPIDAPQVAVDERAVDVEHADAGACVQPSLLPSGRPARIRILDLACGGGDVTLAVARRLLAAGLDVEIEGWDRSATAVGFANQRAAAMVAGPSEQAQRVRFLQRDVQQLDAGRQFDVVMCTLFLHHLDSEQASACLKRMFGAARELVLIDDLRRTWLGYRLAQLGCHLLTRSRIVHADGPLSVRAAFTEAELRALAHEAGLPCPQFVRHWPQRFLMRWNVST